MSLKAKNGLSREQLATSVRALSAHADTPSQKMRGTTKLLTDVLSLRIAEYQRAGHAKFDCAGYACNDLLALLGIALPKRSILPQRRKNA